VSPPPSSPSLPPVYIIEHSTGVFVKWQHFLFFKRPKFSWADNVEGRTFSDYGEALDNLSLIRRTHDLAYLVELKPKRVRA
jgi:hypothetical protein